MCIGVRAQEVKGLCIYLEANVLALVSSRKNCHFHEQDAVKWSLVKLVATGIFQKSKSAEVKSKC